MLLYLQKHKLWIYIAVLLLLSFLFIAAFFIRSADGQKTVSRPRDYADIIREGVLHVATEYNSVSFFVDEDTFSGFNYELIQAFARDYALKVDITPEMAFDKSLEGLAGGVYDVIANGILATSELKDSLLLTTPIALSRLVLVQRKPESVDDTLFVKSLLDLAGKTIHVVKNSPYILRIRNLGDEIGDTIYTKEVERYGSEQLISLVAHGDIDFAVCEESIAEAVADSIPQIDISTAIGFSQFYSWAVSKQSPVLLDTLNSWIETFKQGKEYRQIYRKYYR